MRVVIMFYSRRLILILCSLSLVSASTHAAYVIDGRPGRARTEAKQLNFTERFLERFFFDGRRCSVPKALNLIKTLQEDIEHLKNNIYETTLIHAVRLEVKSKDEAYEDALDEIDEKKNGYIIATRDVFVPAVQAFIESCESGGTFAEQVGLAQSFVVAFAGIYIPNVARTARAADSASYIEYFRRLFGYKVPYRSEKIPPAVNLSIPSTLLSETETCVGLQASADEPLLTEDLQVLKKCDFDFSRLEPLKSPLFGPPDADAEADDPYFPPPDTVLDYRRVSFSGAGSPKLFAEFRYKDKKKKIKVKIGKEVHRDPTVSHLAAWIGLHQDPVRYRERVKINLGKLKYEAFRSRWSRWYANFDASIESHGTSRGEDWVVLRDALLELDPADRVQLGSFDPMTGDLQDRREFRSMLLFFGWLGVVDEKPDNYRIQFKGREDGRWEVEYSLQDVGYALVPLQTLRFPGRFLRNGLNKLHYNVNAFETTFLEKKKKNIVVHWYDPVLLRKNRFSRATYADLKWMARKIASIPEKEIREAFVKAGWPKPVAELYTIKVTKRRNEIVRVFELEEEFAIYKTPDLTQYNSEWIKDGKIDASQKQILASYPGHTEYNLMGSLPETLFKGIFDVPIHSLSDKIKKKFGDHRLNVHVGRRLGAGANLDKLIKMPLGTYAGIRVDFSREVGINPDPVTYEKETQAFYARDRVSFEFIAGNDALDLFKNTVMGSIPLVANLHAGRFEFEFVQYGETWYDAMKAELKIFEAVFRTKDFVAYELKPGEVFKSSFGAAIKAGLNGGMKFGPRIGMNAGWETSNPVYYARDYFGQLRVYIQSRNDLSFAVEAKVIPANYPVVKEIDLARIALGITRSGIGTTAYTFNLPKTDLSLDALDRVQMDYDREALRALFSDDYDALPVRVREDFKVKATGTRSEALAHLLRIFNIRAWRESGESEITLPDGTKRKFMRFRLGKVADLGFRDLPLPKLENAFLFREKMSTVTVEIDRQSPKTFVANLLHLDYRRKQTREKLETMLDGLNQLYSKSPSEPFFNRDSIPSMDDRPTYRKILSSMYIYLYGEGLFKKLETTPKDELKRQIRMFFVGPSMDSLNEGTEAWMFYRRLLRIQKMVKDGEDLDSTDFMRRVAKIIDLARSQFMGLDLLRYLFGDDHMLVMGEIYGIYPNSARFQNFFTHNAGIRFAGKSWGVFVRQPPLQQFLLDHKIIPPSEFIDIGFDQDIVFGDQPTGRPIID